jgi:hypothetical protein
LAPPTGLLPLLRWVGCHCRYPTDRVPLHTSFKSREGAKRAPTRRHVPCSTEPCLPTKVGSRGATCLVASDPAFLIGRASAPPPVPWLWTPPPYKGGLCCTTCPVAMDHTSLQGKDLVHHVSCSFGSCLPSKRAPVRHVSYNSKSCLPGREGISVPHVLQLQIMPTYRGGLRSATCPKALDPTSL